MGKVLYGTCRRCGTTAGQDHPDWCRQLPSNVVELQPPGQFYAQAAGTKRGSQPKRRSWIIRLLRVPFDYRTLLRSGIARDAAWNMAKAPLRPFDGKR